MKKTWGPPPPPSCTRYSHAVSVRPPSATVNGGPARSSVGAVSRTWRYSGSTTVVGMPAAAWKLAKPLTASPNPPVRANGQYSAVRWTTPMRSAAGAGERGPATGPRSPAPAAERIGVVHLTAEYWPFARTGGLGEAVSGLASFQAAAGMPTTVVLPLYRQVRATAPSLERAGPPF